MTSDLLLALEEWALAFNVIEACKNMYAEWTILAKSQLVNPWDPLTFHPWCPWPLMLMKSSFYSPWKELTVPPYGIFPGLDC